MHAMARLLRVNEMVQGQASDRDVQNLTRVFSEAVGVAKTFARQYQDQIVGPIGAINPSEQQVLVLAGLTAHVQTWADALIQDIVIPTGIGGFEKTVEKLVRSPGLDRWVTELMVELCTFDFDDDVFPRVVAGTGETGIQTWRDMTLLVAGSGLPGDEPKSLKGAQRKVKGMFPGLFGILTNLFMEVGEPAEATEEKEAKEIKKAESPDPRTFVDAPKEKIDAAGGIARDAMSFTYATRPGQCRIEGPLAEALVKDLAGLRVSYALQQERGIFDHPRRKRDDVPPEIIEKPPRES